MKPFLLALLGTVAASAIAVPASAQVAGGGQSVSSILGCEEETTATAPPVLDPGSLPIDDIVTGGGGTGGGGTTVPSPTTPPTTTPTTPPTTSPTPTPTPVSTPTPTPVPTPTPTPVVTPTPATGGGGSAGYMSSPSVTGMRVGGDGDPRTYMAGALNPAYRQNLATVKTYPSPAIWGGATVRTIGGQKILTKPGADISGLKPSIVSIIDEINFTAAALKLRSPIMTSGKDSVHGEGSLHYSGGAIDMRCNTANGYTDTQCKQWVVSLANALGPNYDVIFEDFDSDSNHVHIEYDPK